MACPYLPTTKKWLPMGSVEQSVPTINKTSSNVSNDTAGVDANAVIMQRTLKSTMCCDGVGLHSGSDVSLTFCPAPVNHGIVFKRMDLDAQPLIPALWSHVSDSRLCTTIANDNGISVSTVEHLMAALAGCGIDNLLIEITGAEVPIMDGSSQPFVFLIECAGVIDQNTPRRVIRVLKPIHVKSGDCQASLTPADKLSLEFDIDFGNNAVSAQSMKIGLVNGSFCKEISRARTFGFLHEVEAMQKAGLAKGGSLDNAIVVNGDTIMNKDGLRYDDEFVRHKILDAVGDLYMAGGVLMGRFSANRSGHALNNQLLRALFADDDAWCYDEIRGQDVKMAIDGGIVADNVHAVL